MHKSVLQSNTSIEHGIIAECQDNSERLLPKLKLLDALVMRSGSYFPSRDFHED